MINQIHTSPVGVKGVKIHAINEAARKELLIRLEGLGLSTLLSFKDTNGALQVALRDEIAPQLAPNADTLQLADRLVSTLGVSDIELDGEILAALFSCPRPLEFPSYQEFKSAVSIRENIVRAAKRTQLAFDTRSIERPTDCWRHSEDSGFTILPGHPIIDALTKATQPDVSGKRYAFSCYRATEYVILLGIAQELALVNPDLLNRLQARWEKKAIMSGAFHEAFLIEQGTIDNPVPGQYYVPGDRVWFRNPDPVSSDISGYEGSWVIYLGRGLFSNFWKADAPYTLKYKCLEVFHWRNGVAHDATGRDYMDEAVVEERVGHTSADPDESKMTLDRMMRFRDPSGVYADGGCIDASREYPRLVHPETSDIRLEV